MPSPLSDETVDMFRLLADGQWHPYEELKAKIAARIAPGRAWRRYQNDLEARREQKGNPTYDTDLDEDERIKYGGLRLAQGSISKWKGKGVIVQDLDGIKRVKLKHGFWPAGMPEGDVPVVEENIAGRADDGLVQESVPAEPKPRKASPKKESVPAPSAQDPPSEDLGVGEVTPEPSEPSEVPLPTVESPPARKEIKHDFLTRALSFGVTGPIYGPNPAIFHTRPLASLSGPQEAIEALEESIPAQYSRDDYLKAVEERFPQLVEPEAPVGERTEEKPVKPVMAAPSMPAFALKPSLTVEELPRCPECFGLIQDWEAHLAWHGAYVKRSELSGADLWSESQVRRVVSDELGSILDRFQVSMQGYLEQQFAQLSGLVVHFQKPAIPWAPLGQEVSEDG